MHLLLALLIAVMVFCGYLIADAMVAEKRRRNSLRARIAPDGSLSNDPEAEKPTGLNGDPSPQARMLLGFLRNLGVNVDETIRKLEPRFGQGGFTSPDAPIYYLFFQRILSLFLFIAGLLMLMNNAEGTNHLLISFVGLLVLIVALFGPYLYLQNKIDNRKKILQRGFPDTLDLLLICVESGLALDASLNRVCAELQRAFPEITAELNRTRLELALINDRVRALMNLGERTDMVAFKSLTAALIQSERFGTSLTDTLRVLSEDFRLQRLTEAETRAARLPVLLTIPLIFLLMPAFILIVLGPAIVNFMHGNQQLEGK